MPSAGRHFEQSLALLKRDPDPAMVTDVRAMQGMLMLNRGQVRDARARLQECLAFWSAQKHPRWVALCELQLGLIEERAENRAASLASSGRSRRRYVQVNARVQAAAVAQHQQRVEAMRP